MIYELLVLIIFLLLLHSTTHATVISSNHGSVFSVDNSIGTVTWINPSNVKTDNVNWSDANNLNTDTSNYLKVTGFLLNIPSGTIITGISVMVKRRCIQADIMDVVVSLVKNNNIAGDNNAGVSNWTNYWYNSVYGDSMDLWGETWTDADVNDAGFGMVIAARSTGSIDDARIDYITITVYYEFTLPVTLMYFQATPYNGNVMLEWETASEENNNYFSIEKSPDGIDYKELMQVDGMGNKYAATSYSETDPEPYRGINYYRLKQVDYNSKFSFSRQVSVDMSDISLPELTVFPNPAAPDNINVRFDNLTSGVYRMELYNLAGSLIYTQQTQVEQGTAARFDCPYSLFSGAYILTGRSSNSDKVYVTKFIIK